MLDYWSRELRLLYFYIENSIYEYRKQSSSEYNFCKQQLIEGKKKDAIQYAIYSYSYINKCILQIKYKFKCKINIIRNSRCSACIYFNWRIQNEQLVYKQTL